MMRSSALMWPEHLHQLESAGHVTCIGIANDEMIEAMRRESARLATLNPDQVHGIRRLLERSPLISAWAHSEEILALLPEGMSPVRGILFDKVPGANWKVAWHQDLTIAVAEKIAVLGYGPWSLKDEVIHVQPPLEVLVSMVTLRLHLDDTPVANGALRVLPGSHAACRLDAEQIRAWRSDTPDHACEAHAGDLLMMKPLLLHASSSSEKPGHRRVVHVEYARTELLHPALRWLMA